MANIEPISYLAGAGICVCCGIVSAVKAADPETTGIGIIGIITSTVGAAYFIGSIMMM